MLYIKDWNETFENAHSRKRVNLQWLMLPLDQNSNGYVSLTSMGEAGMAAYGVFISICQWSASRRKELRGCLCRSDGQALTEKQLAGYLRIDTCQLSASLDILKSPEIGWIIDDSLDSELSHSHPSANNLPTPSQNVPLEKEEEIEGEGEEEGEEEREVAGPQVAYSRQPTWEAVELHFFQIGNPGEAKPFFDHYQAQGWRVGNGLDVRDWKALASKWMSNPKRNGNSGPTTFVNQAADAMGQELARFVAGDGSQRRIEG